MVRECEIAHFGYNDATVCILIHRHLSAPMRKSSPFTPVLITRIIRALPIFDTDISFTSWRYRLICKCWACLVLSTQYTVHTFPVIARKLYFETHIPQILLTSARTVGVGFV